MPKIANLEKKIAKYKEMLAELADKAGKESERGKFRKLLKRAQRAMVLAVKDQARHAAAKAKGHQKKADAAAKVEEAKAAKEAAKAAKAPAPAPKA